MKTRGFTLIELLVTIAIGAILLSAGLPAFGDFIRDNRMQSAAAGFYADLSTARTEAARTYRIAAVCPSTNGSGCDGADWNDGRIVYVDNNGNGSADAGEVIRWSGAVAKGPAAAATGFTDRVAFRATGAAVNAGSIKLCDARSGDHGRLIDLNAAGRIISRKVSCP